MQYLSKMRSGKRSWR